MRCVLIAAFFVPCSGAGAPAQTEPVKEQPPEMGWLIELANFEALADVVGAEVSARRYCQRDAGGEPGAVSGGQRLLPGGRLW